MFHLALHSHVSLSGRDALLIVGSETIIRHNCRHTFVLLPHPDHILLHTRLIYGPNPHTLRFESGEEVYVTSACICILTTDRPATDFALWKILNGHNSATDKFCQF